MPNCFQLFRQGSGNAQSFMAVDNAICAYLDVPADDVEYVNGWYDYIGFSLACGKSLEAIGDQLHRYEAKESPWARQMLAAKQPFQAKKGLMA